MNEEEKEEEKLRERREEEFEVLKSIFSNDLRDLRETDAWKIVRPPEMIIHLEPLNTSRGSHELNCRVDLRIKMTLRYPLDVPEISIAESHGLSQAQQDALLNQLIKMATNQAGEELIYELCTETQTFLAENGCKIFSSFYEEMEERRKIEERKKSEGHSRLTSLERQVMAKEVVMRREEIDEEERLVKEEERTKCGGGRRDDTKLEDEFRVRDEWRLREGLRMKKNSECEESRDGTEKIYFRVKGVKHEVVRGCSLGYNHQGESTYSGILLETGQMLAIHRWQLCTKAMNRKVKFLDSETEMGKQLTLFENEMANLQKIRHVNLVSYIGLEKTELVKERKIILHLFQEFCRGASLDLYITGEQTINITCLHNVASQVLVGLEYLHGLDIIHRNLRHSSVFIQPDGIVKVADFSLDLKIREFVSVTNKEILEDVYPLSLGRGGKKCDIYRFGLILISVLQGSIVKDQNPKLPGSLPVLLQDFLSKCLLKDEKERWSADQLLEHAFLTEFVRGDLDGWGQAPHPLEALRPESTEPVMELNKDPIIIENSKQSRLNQDFTIISWIGRGGFGDVIQVKNKLDDQTYAIKRIRLNPADRQLNKKIMREVKLLSRLNHENVVRYYNSWQEVTLVSPDTDEGSTSTATTEEGNGEASRLGNNSLSMLGFQPPSFKSPLPSRQEDSEWSVSFMPPESDSDSESDSESFHQPVAALSQESDSGRIIFGEDISESGSEDISQSTNNEISSEEQSEKRLVQLNTLYIQMEYCEKKTLRNYIDEGLHKDMKKVWQMFREIIDGLVHIHTQGMIHRDLKPVNIFIDSHDNIKIGDFGLATTELIGSVPAEDIRKEDMDQSIAVVEDMTGLVGTALYTAPEVTKRNASYNQKVDLYSLGVIFFEMCHPPLLTGMERIQVLTALRSPEIVFPEDWDRHLLPQQTYIVTWLLDHDPIKRPTSHDLLMSDYLPPAHVEESRIQETVRNAMKNKNSKAYRHLINSCMSQPMSLPKDVHFDGDTVKPGLVRKLGAAYALFHCVAQEVFELHGAVPLDSHLMLPMNAQNPWKGLETSVQIMTRSGDIICLPHDLRISFARYLARLKLNNFKRYSFGKVVKEKKVFGLHPKEYTECAFDIITGISGQVVADAELLVVCEQIIKSLGDWKDTKFIFRLGHGNLVKGILLHLGIPEKKHQLVVDAVKQFGAQKTQISNALNNIGLGETGVSFLLSLLDADTGLNQLTSILRSVTKRRGEASELVKAALQELKTIQAAAVRLGLTFEVQFSIKSLYPPCLYSGMVLQLIRVLPSKTTRSMDIVAAGGRYNSLVHSYREYLEVGSLREEGENIVQEDELCATGFSLSVDRLVSALSKQQTFNPTVCQVLVAGDEEERAHVCSEFWKCGIKTVLSVSTRMDELTELARELGAEIVIFATNEIARISFGDKEGRFLVEKKIALGEVVNLVSRDLKFGLEPEPSRSEHFQLKPSFYRDERIQPGPKIDYNFDLIDREKYSMSKKKQEICKSMKLATALSRFDSSCHVLVVALGLPGSVIKYMAGNLEMEDEDKLQTSLNQLINQFPRYRNYFAEVSDVMIKARFRDKASSSLVLFSLEDNSFRILH